MRKDTTRKIFNCQNIHWPQYFGVLIIVFLYPCSLLGHELNNSYPSSGQPNVVQGTVTDAKTGDVLPGVNISVSGTTTGTFSAKNGHYSLAASANDTLVFSFVGYDTKKVVVGEQNEINVSLKPTTYKGQEMVVVGFGATQKKESLVSAITQASGEELEKTGNVPNIGSALTGKLPGVITVASTGLPGGEDPRIYIRGQSTWHGNAQPLILVDGVKRSLNSVALSSVASISVLKDAAATAIYGVQGGNGVILVTTKKGRQGEAKITAEVNTTVKAASKLPTKLDSPSALELRNRAIEYELGVPQSSGTWQDYLPEETINKYRNPANLAERERYPNVDWQDVLFKNSTQSYSGNVSVRGGTDFVKYFANADFRSEGDLIRTFENNRGYDSGFGDDRLNVRSNLDFTITPTTTLKANLAGSYNDQKTPFQFNGNYGYWSSAYFVAPDAYLPKYADGSWGADPNTNTPNSASVIAVSGVGHTTTTQLSTDFELNQDLSMFAKGLGFKGKVAIDNTFVEGGRGINDLYNTPQTKYIDSETGAVTHGQNYDSNTHFVYAQGVKWSSQGGNVQNGSSYRKIFYQGQLNYDFSVGDKNNFTLLGLFNRTQNARGSEIPHYRENWVFRTTYNYDQKYLIEYNGSYNGSEKFSSANRFAFFSSGGVGWNISNEKFMQNIDFVDNLKVRASYGTIGDDNVNARFLYKTQWAYGGNTTTGTSGWRGGQRKSPYTWYNVQTVGNPDVHWESVTKKNLGVDFSFFDGLVDGSVDIFRDKRKNIIIFGNNRAIPDYYGTDAPVANLGKTKNKGYEVSLNISHTFANRFRLWSRINFTHARNTVLNRDSPALLPDYQKDKGKPISQAYGYVDDGYYNTWDQLYSSTQFNTDDNQKRPGGKYIIDYNADGIIDSDDNIPYGFSGTPENTYNATIGFNLKGFSAQAQFYAVNNVTRYVGLGDFGSQTDIAYSFGRSYWSKTNTNPGRQIPRWRSTPNGAATGTRDLFDGSYVRLKNAQVAYTFGANSGLVKNLGIARFRVYLSGNNLFLWTNMPDDREANYAGAGFSGNGAYPTLKRYNLGVNITF